MINLILDKKGGINKGDIDIFETENKNEVYVIQLTKNGQNYNLTGKTVELSIIEKKRKYGDMLQLQIEDAVTGKVRLEIVSAITKQDGAYDFQLTVKGADGFIELFPVFRVDIKNNISTDIAGTIVSSPSFTILNDKLQKVAEWDVYFAETSGKLEEKYTTRLNELNASLENKANDLYNTKADKTTTDNIQGQVNNLVLGAVGDGNNAEVVQARGKYNVLNERFLYSENKLNDFSEQTVIETVSTSYTIGGYYDINGQLKTLAGTAYIKIPNDNYTKVGYKGKYGQSLVGICFLNSDDTLNTYKLQSATQVTLTEYTYYDVPLTCAYICISSFGGVTFSNTLEKDILKIDYDNIKDVIGVNELEENFNSSFVLVEKNVNVSVTYTDGGYYDSKGVIKPLTGMCTTKVENKNYTKVGYKGKYGANACALVFINSQNAVISYISSVSNITISSYQYYDVPIDCAYILYSSYTNVDYGINFMKNYYQPIVGGTSTYPYNDKFVGVEWVAFGDSLTQGTVTLNVYHKFLGEKLGITVINNGVGGTGFLNGATNNFQNRALNISENANIITIFGSFNDISVWDGVKDTLYSAIDTTIKNILSKNPTINIGMVTPTPWGYVNRVTNKNAKNELYISTIIEYCQNNSIPCLDLYSESGLMPWNEAQKALFFNGQSTDDNVHPNAKAHEEKIAPKFEQFLLKLCK